MNQLVQHWIIKLITIYWFMNFHVAAQDGQESNPPVRNPIHPSVPVVLGILSVMFALTFLLCAYAKFCHSPVRNSNSSTTQNLELGGLIRSRSRFSGIDKTAIESLPFFRFSSLKGSKEGLECAVCISKFEDSEVLRLLPKCRHAFHMTCIDRWLERHSSCPLCRYKFDAREIRSLTYSNSLRYVGNGNTSNDLNDVEIFVQREEFLGTSSSINSWFVNSLPISSFRKSDKRQLNSERDESVPQSNLRAMHNLKHKIIISDVVSKSRWSDVNSSDLLLLNSEMLSETSSNRFSNERFSLEEQTVKVKEDMERKRLFESKFGMVQRSYSISDSNNVQEQSIARTSNIDERRSMSEMANVARFSYVGSNRQEERTRRLWLPIARRTVRWFAGQETVKHQDPDHSTGPSSV